jgi:transcriptional regulator with XRE-family HTH domain
MSKAETRRNLDKFNRHLGRRLAHRRVEVGRTVAQLDQALFLTPGTVAAFEKGVRGIGAGLLFGLSRILGVPVSYFFEDAPAAPKARLGDLPSPGAVADAERFVEAFFKVEDRAVRRDILGLMKAAAEGKHAGRAS